MQSVMCEKQHRDGIWQMLKTMTKEEGRFRAFKGGSAMAMGAGPAHAMYFGCFRVAMQQGQLFQDMFGLFQTQMEQFPITLRIVNTANREFKNNLNLTLKQSGMLV